MSNKIHALDLQFLDAPQTIASFLLETDDGPLLVETGPHATYPRLSSELGRLGYQPKDIQHVFLTHIHLDHAGAAWALAREGAKVYVHPVGAPHLIDPSRLMDSARRIYQDQMDYLWGQMEAIPEDQVVAVRHGEAIRVGGQALKAWHTPGHAVHHIAWQWDKVIFTGDVAGVRIGNGPVVPPCPPPDINLEDWEDSLRLLLQLQPEELYLTHFGPVKNIKAHLDQLKARLWEWANWIKPHFEAGKKAGEISGAFQEYVEKELLESGVSQAGLEQYNKANPAYMSVTGLMRYWKKKREKQDQEAGTRR